MPTQRFVKWFMTYEAGLMELMNMFNPVARAVVEGYAKAGIPVDLFRMQPRQPGLSLESATQAALMLQAFNTPKEAKNVHVSVGRKQGFQYTLNRGNRFGWKRNWMGSSALIVFYVEILDYPNLYTEQTALALRANGWIAPELVPNSIHLFER